jgi:DNA polymerase-3 subunit gamma/tau
VAAHKVAHAYLFSGPRGTGKTSTGRLLAKAANCRDQQDGEPCNKCDPCLSFLEGRAIDLVELDAASNRGIDEIRSLRDKVGFAPAGADFKVYIIDEAHMLTEPAFNALLKTLEEPPPHAIFVLATTEPHKIPATIASRCQRFDFHRIPLQSAIGRLQHICKQEGISCPQEGLELIARTATGSLRDAINLLEQVVDYHGRELTVEMVQSGLGLSDDSRSGELARLVLQRDLGGGLALIASVRDDGLDLRQFQRDVVSHLRRLLLVSAGAESGLGLTLEQVKEMKGLLEGVSADDLVHALRALGLADLRGDPLSSLPLELALAECVLSKRVEAAVRAAPEPVARRQEPLAPTPQPVSRAAAPSAPARQRQKPASPEAPQATAAKMEEEPSPVVDVEPTEAGVETAPLEPIPPSGELAQFQARWPDVYQLARKINFKAGALLNSGCAITGLEDSTLIFGFRHNALVEKMNSGEGGAYLQALREAVQRVIGPEYDVRCVFEPQAATSRASGSGGGHLVQAARELGARVVGEKD